MLNINDYFNRAYLGEFFASAEDIALMLDLGCGERPYKFLYQDAVDHVVCADIEARTDDLDVIASAEQLPFADGVFDAVLFSEVIEHIPEMDKALHEINRVLKEGGSLILTYPFMYRMHELPNDYRRLTEFGLQRELRLAGFEIDQLRRRGGLFSLASTLTGILVDGFFSALTRIPGVGILFRPLQWLIQKGLQFLYASIVRATRRTSALRPTKPGDGLSGIGGYLAVWTLGYCVLAKKV